MFELLLVLAILHILGFLITLTMVMIDVVRYGLSFKYYIYGVLLALFWPYMSYWLASAVHEEKNDQIRYWVKKVKELQEELVNQTEDDEDGRQ